LPAFAQPIFASLFSGNASRTVNCQWSPRNTG